MNTESTKASRAIPATKRWKRWHFKSRIILMLLGAIAIIAYLFRSGLAAEYEGLGAALLAVSCGGFLVWHAIHMFAEQDALDEQQLNQATASSSQPNPDDKGTNSTTPPP